MTVVRTDSLNETGYFILVFTGEDLSSKFPVVTPRCREKTVFLSYKISLKGKSNLWSYFSCTVHLGYDWVSTIHYTLYLETTIFRDSKTQTHNDFTMTLFMFLLLLPSMFKIFYFLTFRFCYR